MELTELMQKKLNSGREYRSMTMAAKNDTEDYVVEGYATTFDEPYYLYTTQNKKGEEVQVFEQVDRDAFTNADLSDVIFQYDHEGRVFARLSNDTLKLNADEHGLNVTAYLGGTETGRNLYEEIKGGYTNKMSFGFTVKADNVKPDGEKRYLRTITEVGKLFDVSAVSYPQNNFTEISARSHIDGVIDEVESERIRLEEAEELRREQREALMNKVRALRKDTNGN